MLFPVTRSRRISVVLVDFIEIRLGEFEMRIIHRRGGDVLAHMLDRDPALVDAAHRFDRDQRRVHTDAQKPPEATMRNRALTVFGSTSKSST